MKLVITIDTEEDNWGGYQESRYTCENIERIPRLQELFDEYHVQPTYLVTYPVAMDRRSRAILREIADRGRCEIGTHCHPWNTPPHEEERTAYNSMLCNLSSDLQYRKIRTLHEAIERNLGISPVSFRAGRWGFNHNVAQNLLRLGYKVDSSITALWDWTDEHGNNFSDILPQPYYIETENSKGGECHTNLLEVPFTIGFLQSNFALCQKAYKAISNRYWRRIGLSGALYRLNLLNKVWLSPEFFSSKEMIMVATVMLKTKYRCLNMSFHSPSLVRGLTPIVKNAEDERRFLARIKEFLHFTKEEGIESITLSEATGLQ